MKPESKQKNKRAKNEKHKGMHDNRQVLTSPMAVIHLGARAVTMLVVESGEKGADGVRQMRRIDFLEKPVPLAQDIFQQTRISPESVDLCVDALSTYLKCLKEYGVDMERNPPRIVVTNILSEAASQEGFLNRVHMACGFGVEPLDDGEMTRLVYVRAKHVFEEQPALADKKVLVIHIGPGNTRVLFFKKGRIAAYASYRLGAIRVRSAIQQSGIDQEGVRSMTRGQIRGHVEQICFDFAGFGIEKMLTIGTEIQMAAPAITGHAKLVSSFSVKKLDQFLKLLESQSTDEIVRMLEVDYFTAEAIVPALHANFAIARKLGLTEITTTGGDFEEGLLNDLLTSGNGMQNFQEEVIQSAVQLAQKFQTDSKHGRHVENLCLKLFHGLQEMHALSAQDELILRVAAILHECGSFVSRKAHHHHSYYLIKNSDIFGLSELETGLAALVARYHRHSPPREGHPEYHDLPRDARMRVSKMAALIRVADSLEKGHDQRVRDIRLEIRGRTLYIICSGTQDLRIEQLSLESKGDLFRMIYGMDIVLEADKN